MNATRLRSVFFNTAFSQLAQVLGQVILVPLFLRYWGREQYGYWLVLFAIPSAVALSDFGIGSVSANELSLLGESNRERRRELMDGTWTMQALISLAALLVVGVCLGFGHLTAWLALPAAGASTYQWATVLLCLYSLLIMQAMTFNGIFRAKSQYNQYLRALGITRLLEVAFTFLVLALGGRAVAMAATYAGLRMAALAYFYGKLPPADRPSISFGSLRAIKPLMPLGVAFLAFPGGQAVQNHLPVVILNHLVGPIGVVVFSTCRQVVRLTSYLMSMINNSIWPEYSLLMGEGRNADAARLHRLSISVAWPVCLVAIGGLGLFGNTLLEFWTRGRIIVSRAEMFCFAVPILFNGIWSTSSVVLSATNNHAGLAMRFICGSVLAGGLCTLMIRLFGVVGAPLSMLALDLVLIPYVLRASCRVLGDSVPSLLKDVLQMTELRRSGLRLLWNHGGAETNG